MRLATWSYNVGVTPLVLIRATIILACFGLSILGHALAERAEGISNLASRLPAWRE